MDMEIDHPLSLHYNNSNIARISNGCWTCRLRRKKCDETHPLCGVCAALHITCNYSQDKPDWMDGGVRQAEMAERFKQEVKEYRRRGDLQPKVHEYFISGNHDIKDNPDIHAADNHRPERCLETMTTILGPQQNQDVKCTLAGKLKDGGENITVGRSDTILLMFYIERLFPFLFPFYSPSLFQGGRAWILEMMTSSPVVRQALLCSSSYFFSLARGAVNNRDAVWDTVLVQTSDAFEVLRQALQVIDGSNIANHLHGAVRIMASIMQVLRFEIAILSFDNCQAHLNGALALFKQLLNSSDVPEQEGHRSRFNDVFNRLGPSCWILPSQCTPVPSAEQAAFRFSSALLILDDIILSTVLQEQPRLYEYHRCLLSKVDRADPPVDLEAAMGCQNWTLLEIGEIAILDEWKQRCKATGSLDITELIRRADIIKASLEAHLAGLETNPEDTQTCYPALLEVFTEKFGQQSESPACQRSLLTRVWSHAAFLYLSVVVSGWQPSNVDVRFHVGQIIDLLTRQISPPALLRTMVWPFCVAGCLAEPVQKAQFREMVNALQPPSVFGTVHKALEIMENVWENTETEDATCRDLATCFGNQGDVVWLV